MTVHAFDRKMAAAGDEQVNPDRPILTFADFWAAYPRRVARKDAERAWMRIDSSEYPKILAALEVHKKTDDWRRSGGQFIPYPASYLNGERWTDEIGIPTMGQCVWNQNGTREEGKPRCSAPGVVEKRGLVYCKEHGERA